MILDYVYRLHVWLKLPSLSLRSKMIEKRMQSQKPK